MMGSRRKYCRFCRLINSNSCGWGGRVQLMVERMFVSNVFFPKCLVPASLSNDRPIAGLTATRNMLGYVWTCMARDLPVKCVPTGFMRGRQAAEGVWAIRRCLDIPHEHGNELVVLNIDVSAAFDRLLHPAVISSLDHKAAPIALLGFTAKLLSGLQCTLKLGTSVSNMVTQQCGMPQGHRRRRVCVCTRWTLLSGSW